MLQLRFAGIQVIQQMFGAWRIKFGFYVPIAKTCKAMLKQFPHITGTWIPREKNSLADELSKAELKKAGVKFRIQPEEWEAKGVGGRNSHSWQWLLSEGNCRWKEETMIRSDDYKWKTQQGVFKFGDNINVYENEDLAPIDYIAGYTQKS